MQMASRSFQKSDDDDDRKKTTDQDYFYGSGNLVSFTGDRDTYYAFTDYQGSMTTYARHNSIKEKYEYDAFGTPVDGSFKSDNVLGYNAKCLTGRLNSTITDIGITRRPWVGLRRLILFGMGMTGTAMLG